MKALTLLISLSACSACAGAQRERVVEDPLKPATVTEPAPVEERPRLEVELIDGPVPWTHLDVRNDAQAFQFAIVSDRTGGARPGVFESALDKLNLLEPEFVMSVGDLIQGYTDDMQVVDREWNEVDAFLTGLRAPFFRVPGNHDITNEAMHGVWRRRYGPDYYSFVYRDVLFVCLNSMDGGFHVLSATQKAWLAKTLAEHTGVRWTLLFLHSPLWDDFRGVAGAEPYGPDWSQVATLLGERPYTAFAGHHHRYLSTVRNDRRLITLATTGGGSGLRGLQYGEFDHVAWVTMTDRGPLMANLLLEGVLPEDVRTEAMRVFQGLLEQSGALSPKPIFHTGNFQQGKAELSLHNPGTQPMAFEFAVRVPLGFEVEPSELGLTLQPGQSETRTIDVTAGATMKTPMFAIPFDVRVSSLDETGRSVAMTGTSVLSVVQGARVKRRTRPITIDGSLKDWPALPIDVKTPAQVLKNTAALRDEKDNRFRIGMLVDADFLYVAVNVEDDERRAEKKARPWEQDGIELRFDARAEPQRSHGRGRGDAKDTLLIALSPSDVSGETWEAKESWLKPAPEGTEMACVATPTGFGTEVKIPRKHFDAARGERATEVRVNVAVNDGDADGQSQSWWWPNWRSGADIPGSGTVTFDVQ